MFNKTEDMHRTEVLSDTQMEGFFLFLSGLATFNIARFQSFFTGRSDHRWTKPTA